MKYTLLSLMVLMSANAFAAESTNETGDQKPSKIYFRCESRHMEFNENSQMKEIAPGRFALSVPTTEANLKDQCVLSVVDLEASGPEICFMDYFPNISTREGVVMGKSYSLHINQNKASFEVQFSTTGNHLVTFEMENQNLFVKKAGPPKMAMNK